MTHRDSLHLVTHSPLQLPFCLEEAEAVDLDARGGVQQGLDPDPIPGAGGRLVTGCIGASIWLGIWGFRFFFWGQVGG